MVEDFFKRHWCVFREAGVSIPIWDYKMIIYTGGSSPVCVKQTQYGMHESLIMQKALNVLINLGFIVLDNKLPWGARITLAPKPHQEYVTNINEYVCRFCTNYILLNRITKPAEYNIPRCDDAVLFGLGNAK